ncbi:DUF3253 domain-containing protein [Salinisphaera orenii]|uniref:S-adenosylmethionine tRNA ribosyltransferase n=1 Tax=Salinisphaera orenii YIM 95161 TaxID=1051139 RepID=A0A423PTF1_9GAMM|nr:DUF3253 domain-containing protein [Salinisphaera halophila]ROO28821.1 hypothetical protein SAHL_09770 [Salinisphaera halophila YIM 95161]
MSDGPDAETIVAAVRALLDAREPGRTVCPSEVARRLAGGNDGDWRALMPAVRRVAAERARAGELVVTQRGRAVDALRARGPIRIGYAD